MVKRLLHSLLPEYESFSSRLLWVPPSVSNGGSALMSWWFLKLQSLCILAMHLKSQSGLLQKWSFFLFSCGIGPSMCPHGITIRVIQKVNVILKDNYEPTFLAVLLHDVFLINVQMKPLKTTSHAVGALSRVQSPRWWETLGIIPHRPKNMEKRLLW